MLTLACGVGLGGGLVAAWFYRALLQRWWTRALRRYRLRNGRIAPRYPVVLVHGLMGFDEVEVAGRAHAYFRGIREHLEALGVKVYRPRLPAAAGVATRAEALRRYLVTLPARRVNLVAHSMGGLDARYAISQLGLGRKVVSLITIGTPHRGTPVADVTDRMFSGLRIHNFIWGLSMPREALSDLTHRRSDAFNRLVLDRRGVFYGSIVAHARSVPGLLVPLHGLLARWHGPNDGLVPVASQRWGEVLLEVDADHWAQVGWSKATSVLAMYTAIMRELRARGL